MSTQILSKEFLTVVQWLKLDTPISDERLESLNALFEEAIANKNSGALVIFGRRSAVGIVDSTAVTYEIPESLAFGGGIRDLPTAKVLKLPGLFSASYASFDQDKIELFKERQRILYENSAADCRLNLGT